jgi:hypothetical protein
MDCDCGPGKKIDDLGLSPKDLVGHQRQLWECLLNKYQLNSQNILKHWLPNIEDTKETEYSPDF